MSSGRILGRKLVATCYSNKSEIFFLFMILRLDSGLSHCFVVVDIVYFRFFIVIVFSVSFFLVFPIVNDFFFLMILRDLPQAFSIVL